MSKKNKTNMDVIDVQNLYDFKAFKDKDYINFIKRSGGQVFQYYSLLDSYANFLGANGGSEFASDYRETEVTFSREIYKKRVYSSVVLPLYSSDSSTNSIQIALGSNNPGGEGTGSYDDLTYFKPRVTPSWYDRHINSLSFVGGEFRNIYRQATSKVESMTTKSISFITGEFRLPLLTYIHREHESSTTTYLVFIDGSLKKVLLKALIPTESFQTKDMSCYAMAKSTVVEKDILELNFLDLNYVSESPKATPKVLDKFSTKISSPPEPKYLRILNKRGGIRLDFTNNSISVTPYFDWTVNFNFEPKELRTDSHIVDYGNQIKVRLDSRDPSKLIVEVSGQKLYTSLPGFITTNRWFNISIEKKGSEYTLYINKELMATESLGLDTFFSEGTSLTLGNSADTYNGFIGNVSDFIIVKRAALLTDDLFAEHHSIKPVIGSELDFSTGTVKDKNPNIIWTNVNTALYNEEKQGLVFNAGQYLVAEDAPDLSIYNFNNYRIDVEFSLSEVPSLANKVKTLIHKTGVLSGGYSTESGYSLSVERVDDNARLRFQMGRVSILSSTVIRLGFRYSVELIKYKTQLLMFINNVYEGSVLLDAPLDEDIISNLIIGRFQSIPERDFKGIIHALKFTNYFKDLSGSDRYMKYLPENLEYEEILNFEEKSLVWIESNKDINPEDYLSKTNPKFGEQSLELNDTNKAIIRPNTPLYNFTTADFTIEGWFKPTSFRDQNIIISNGVVEDSNNTILLQYLYLDSLGFVNFYADKTITGLISDTLIKSNKAVVLNTWSHIVFTRTKGVFRIYINGEITAQVIANNITIDLSINNTFIGNNNFKGSTSSKTEEPPLSTYVDKPNPTNKESLDITMDKGGILAIPSTPESVWDAVTGVLTVGESGFIANTEAEKAALKKLHDLKYLSKEDIKDLPVLVVLDWIQQEELTMKEKPPVIVIPPSEAVLKSQYNGYIDSFRVIKDESKYSGDSFEVPGLPFGDSNTNLIAHLTFDHQSSSNLEKELLLEFEPAPSISKVDSVIINAETLTNVLKDDFIPEKNTDVVKTDTLFSDRNIKFVDSGILFNDTSSKVLDNVRPEQDFSLEFYIRFNTSVNRYQTLLSNVQEERHLSHYFNIYRYGKVLEKPELTNKLAITKNPGDLSDTLFISEQKFRDDVWYNITIIKVNSYVKLFINGLLDSKVYLPELSVLFSGVGFRLGNSFVADTAMTGNLESFRYTPRLSIYKNSFDPENIYLTEENSEKYIFTEDPTKIYDSFSKKIITDLPNANTTLEDGNLVTRLPENTSKTGITLPANLPSLGIAKEDFTIETKVYLEANRNRRYTDIFCNRASADSSATYLNVSNSSNANGAVFISAVNFYIRQNSIEMNFGENSFTENAWNTICVTRQGDTLRGYVNGSLKVTKDLTNTPNVDLKLNTYGGLRIFDSGQTQAGVMDYFYILRGQALYTEDTYIPGPIDVKHTKFEERYVPAQNDKTSVLPFKTFVENLYTKTEDFAPVTDEESLIKSSLKLNSNTYIKLNFLPRIPKDFMVGVWLKPKFNSSVSNSNMYSIFKWESDDEYKIEYFINKLGQDKLVISKGSLSATVGGYNQSGPQLIVDEWNHIIITKFDDTVTFYYNGYKFKTFNDPKYREMDSNLNSSFYLGYNSVAETDSMVMLVDDVKIFKYREGNFLDLYYNSLETLLEESKIKVTEIPILNSDGSSDLDYWDDTDNHIQSSFIASLGKYYFNSKSPSSTYRHASQMIDVSEYLDLSNNKFFFSWTQSYNEAYATSDNKAECVLYLYNEDERLLRLINPLATDIRTSVSQDREIERYFIDHLPVGTKYIKVKFSLKNHSYITNMKLFIENTGEKFSNFDYLEEYIPPMSYKTHSHALLLSHTNEEYLKRTQAAEIEITPQMFELGIPKGNINILPLNVTEKFKGTITNIAALEV